MCWWSTTIRRDGTLDVLAARAAAEPRVGVVVRPGKLGIGSAHKLGWLHARRMGYARIATLDADLSHDPADVQRLLDALDAGADVALGSRFVPGSKHDYSGLRLAVSQGANMLASSLLAPADRRAHHVVARRQAGARSRRIGRDDRKRRLWLLRHLRGALGAGRADLRRAADSFPRPARWRVEDFQAPDRVRRAQPASPERRSPPLCGARLAIRRRRIARSAAGLIRCASRQANCDAWRASARRPDYSVSAA